MNFHLASAGPPALLALLLVLPAAAQAPDRPRFDGPYVGVSIGLETIIGGGLWRDVDYLASESRPAVKLFAGWRKEFGNGLVLGLEGGIGLEDGDLSYSDPNVAFEYRNNLHWSYGVTAGWRTSDNTLVFAYLSETKREFDVTGRDALGTFSQTDEQGLLHYGLGVEVDISGPIDLRATLGSARADFGDQTLHHKPDYGLEASFGALTRF